jgi:UDP-GlcNAc:undecaprenyl-phosphate/decaprenyl-phosphate GlcNAc-1-phosphate transferase
VELRAAYAFVLALFLAMVLIPPLVRVAGPLRLMDAGGGRKVHAGRIPRIGGVAIFVGFLVPVLLWTPLGNGVWAIVMATAVLFAFGLMDDRLDLDYRFKLLGQLLAAAIVVIGGDVRIERVPDWLGGTLPDLLAIPFTLLVLAGLTNAVNLSDGLDGLAGGISLLAVACLFIINVGGAAGPMLIILAALLGAILGFLRFNTFPARLFMGDAGSQLLGFSVGVLAIVITQRADAGVSPVLPLLVLGLPIFDMLTVMVSRLRRGDSPFQADRTHLHHRLIDHGLSQHEAVSLIYGMQFLLIVLAYVLRDAADWLILLCYLLFCTALLLGEQLIRFKQGLLLVRLPYEYGVGLVGRWLRKTAMTVRVPQRLLAIAIPGFLVLGALGAPRVGDDVGTLAVILLGALVLTLSIRRLPAFAIERISAYTAAVAVAYLAVASQLAALCPRCLVLFYATIAIAAALWVRFSSEDFRVSTLDVLILCAALAAPAMRDIGRPDLGLLALQAIILFYGIEILMHAGERRWDALRLGTIGALVILGVRGLL